MKTKNGIELNLFQSEYQFLFEDYIFYFSSNFYLEKFKREVIDYITIESQKFYNKYRIKTKFNRIFSLSLYTKIEKRGFLVFDNISKNYITDEVEFTDNLIHF